MFHKFSVCLRVFLVGFWEVDQMPRAAKNRVPLHQRDHRGNASRMHCQLMATAFEGAADTDFDVGLQRNRIPRGFCARLKEKQPDHYRDQFQFA